MTKRRSFSTEFKLEAANLIVDQNYTYKQACEAMGVGLTALRRWVDQLREEREGKTPDKSPAFTPDQQEIQRLKAHIRQLEMEKDILKKASALLMSDQHQNIK